MKKKIVDIPEVNLSDVKEFWVLGSQYKDGILGEYNLKTDLKAALGGGGSDDGAVPTIDLRNYTIPQVGDFPVILDIEIPKVDEIIVLTQEGSQIYRKQAIPEDLVETEEYIYSFTYSEYARLDIIKAPLDENIMPPLFQGKWRWEASGLGGDR